MRIKYKVNCKLCQASRGNPKLRARIFAAYYRQDEGDERLSDICREFGFNTAPAYNHAKKHVMETPVGTPTKVEGSIERLKAKIAKETELALDHGAVVPEADYERALTDIIAEGMANLRKSGKTVTISQLITASKIKGDFQVKRRGQDVEVIKSMYRFTSGAQKKQEAPKIAEAIDPRDTIAVS